MPPARLLITTVSAESMMPDRQAPRNVDSRSLRCLRLRPESGKTALAATVTWRLADTEEFERVIWRSLLNAPPLTELLPDIIRTLATPNLPHIPANIEEGLRALLQQLRQQRCLLILDNLETILEDGAQAGFFRFGYKDYGQLLQLVGQFEHQSCILLTSRERPHNLTHLAQETDLVRGAVARRDQLADMLQTVLSVQLQKLFRVTVKLRQVDLRGVKTGAFRPVKKRFRLRSVMAPDGGSK